MQNTTFDNTPGVPPPTGAESASSASHHIVIVGAGIIGLSTAFYLSSSQNQSVSPHQITLLDTSPTLFACASGRAGGFLAKDWFAPASAALGELSFRLHRQLADANDGRRRWGYTQSTSLSLASKTNSETEERQRRRRGDDWLREGMSRVEASYSSLSDTKDVDVDDRNVLVPSWLNCEGGEVELSSSRETTAQLDPHDLCEFLLEAVTQRGVKVRYPVTPLRTVRTAGGDLEGVVITTQSGLTGEETLPCSHILISAGPWSDRVFQRLFPTSTYRLPISSLAGHSIIIRSPFHQPQHENFDDEDRRLDCHAVFADIEGCSWHPEVFSRVNGDIYVAGLNASDIVLPEIATDVKEQRPDIAELIDLTKAMLRQSGDIVGTQGEHKLEVDVIKTGLCHRPVTPAGKPILARLPDKLLGDLKTKTGGGGGVFVATGHGPWGISQSLGTGRIMTEIILGEETSVDVSQLGLQ
ncbi:hypothetical protein TWF694_000078 [Orbilia ellipsospora]|uniref:FAD dependent oxidoreductase domain-containing protein n=1 Tax=Orbilia ellipsospora TaxID=2528407 RepID=A0AAV9XMJ4_9PEZI